MVENLSKIWATGRFDSLNSSPSWWNSDRIISANWIDNLKSNAGALMSDACMIAGCSCSQPKRTNKKN